MLDAGEQSLHALLRRTHSMLSPISSAERRLRFATALAGIALSVAAGWFGLLRLGGSIQYAGYDLPFAVHRGGGADEVKIVYIDELDGNFLDRKSQPALLDKLNEAGARAVLYDIIFDLPAKNPETDRDFAAAMRRFRGVDEHDNPIPGAPRRSVFLACGRRMVEQTGITGEQLIPPTDELLAAADDFGLVAFVHDKKFTVRELTAGTADEPSLTWKAAAKLGGISDDKERLQSRWINYAAPPPGIGESPASRPIQSCGASEVLLGTHPGFFRNKIVVIGAKPGIVGAAAGLDLFSTPFHRLDFRGDLPLMSGVELQANSLINLLQRNWLTRSGPDFDRWLIILSGLITGFGLTHIRPLRGLLLSLAAIAALIAAGTLSIHLNNIWFPWSVPAFLQIPVAFIWGTAAHFYVEKFFRTKLSAERIRIRDAFSKYLSPQMLDRLTEENFKLNPGGEATSVAMMFTDLESFTDMCDRVRDPQRIVGILNDYFERTTSHIFDHDGIIVKFIGDAIFAAWGAPVPDPDAPAKAVRAAWKLFESDKLVVDGENLNTRIGLHFGTVVAGNIGSARRIDYTMIGDAVNLAARLEGLNKLIGTRILMSASVHAGIGGEFRTRRVGRFRVKGRKEATTVYELLGPARQEGEPEWITRYHEAITTLEAGDLSAAQHQLGQVLSLRAGDGPSLFFLHAIEKNEVAADGVVEMKEK